MRFKGTAALAAVFIGIVFYYFLIDLPSEQRKQEEKDRAEKVILFDSENVKAISFIKGENTITLKRLGTDEWQMTAPVNAKGDASAVSDFVSFLNNLNFTRVVEESPKDLTPFGLDTPDLKIILSMNNGETKGVRVGDDHPMGNKVYLSLLNGSRVLAAGVTKNRLDRKVHDLRDKTILDFKTPQIKKIENFYNEHNIQCKIFDFDSNIAELISKSDLAISRSGSSTIAELEFLQVPFIAIPYPFAMDNHQYENALYYKSKNTCWILEQKNFTSNNLSLLLLEIFNNNNDLKVKRKKMFYDRKTNTLDKIKKEILI